MEETGYYQDERGSIPMNVPLPPGKDRADLMDKIKPERVIENMRHKLMGEEQDASGNWMQIQALREFSLTERGAWEVSNLLLGLCHTTMSVSKINERIIKERLKRVARDGQLMLISHWKEYGIKNISQFYFVHSIIMGNAIAILHQADQGSIQELLKGTVYENRSVTTEKKESGRIKRLLGMGGDN